MKRWLLIPFALMLGLAISLPVFAQTPSPAVYGNGVRITEADVTPDLADHTHFGTVHVTGATLTRTYTITNEGTHHYNVTNITLTGAHAGDYALQNTPAYPHNLPPAATVNFDVVFDPSALGDRDATVNVWNDVAGHNPYWYDIQGVGGQEEMNVKNFWGADTRAVATLFSLMPISQNSFYFSDDSIDAVLAKPEGKKTGWLKGLLKDAVDVDWRWPSGFLLPG